jgi:hypothetical protein
LQIYKYKIIDTNILEVYSILLKVVEYIVLLAQRRLSLIVLIPRTLIILALVLILV